ncbi:DUF4357 domain-containing protein [Candidatus Saccharibacteria bacterium]|nr:DUF4357 domain-containing protein [Candidatus Saccharibacteria bacterium]
MAKGILYCMTTVVPGLVKIGKCGEDKFESRMYNLERNGYSNVVGLKRHFAIEVGNYDEKETLLDDIFGKSRVPNTELFALDIDLVVQLLSSFDGKQIYPDPRNESKEEVFKKATRERVVKANWEKIPDGIYHLSEIKKGFGAVEATMRVEDGLFVVEKGSICAPVKGGWMPEVRKNAIIEDNILQEDIECNSPSTAGWIPLGAANNGWVIWKNDDGESIDIYRNKDEEE